MKQKVVIKVAMHSQKCRSKALKIAVGLSGVDSAALKGEDKSQIEIIGDGMDTVTLTTLLRKKVGYAEIVSVEAAEKKDDQEKQCTYQYGMPCYSYQVVATDPYNNTCSIM